MSAGNATMSSPFHVFELGKHTVRLLHVHSESKRASDGFPPPPPKPLLIAHPWEEGEYPTLIFLHGYLLYNSFYSQLIQHVASHGFIIVAPQISASVLHQDGKQEVFVTGTLALYTHQLLRVQQGDDIPNAMVPEQPDPTIRIKLVVCDNTPITWNVTGNSIQLYHVAGPDSTEEIKSVATIADWLISGLLHALPKSVRANLSSLGLAGHSRGGKVAFALALGHAKTILKFSALIGIDPVDGMDKGKQTNPPILTYVPHSFDIKMASLVVGSGLGGLRKNPLFPPCAPEGVSHQDFFNECCYPACHFIARNYGHLDILDDDTKGLRGKVTYCLCKNGKSRKPMRIFVGGIIVAFMKAYMEGDDQDLMALKDNPKIAPIDLSLVAFLEEDPS